GRGARAPPGAVAARRRLTAAALETAPPGQEGGSPSPPWSVACSCSPCSRASAATAGYSSWPLRNGYTGVTSHPSPPSSETMMRFYNQQHGFYCGVDLHARTLSLHVLDAPGKSLLAQRPSIGCTG